MFFLPIDYNTDPSATFHCSYRNFRYWISIHIIFDYHSVTNTYRSLVVSIYRFARKLESA